MKKKAFPVLMLTLLVVVSSIQGCGPGTSEGVRDRTLPSEPSQAAIHDPHIIQTGSAELPGAVINTLAVVPKKISMLGKAWDDHLKLLKEETQVVEGRTEIIKETDDSKQFRASISAFREVDRNKMLRTINTVPPGGTSRRWFLEDMVKKFTLEETKRLMNIILDIYDRDSEKLLDFIAKEGRIGYWRKIRFMANIVLNLNSDDRKLFKELAKELGEDNE